MTKKKKGEGEKKKLIKESNYEYQFNNLIKEFIFLNYFNFKRKIQDYIYVILEIS